MSSPACRPWASSTGALVTNVGRDEGCGLAAGGSFRCAHFQSKLELTPTPFPFVCVTLSLFNHFSRPLPSRLFSRFFVFTSSMQRTSSGVDFSSLLNPDNSSATPPSHPSTPSTYVDAGVQSHPSMAAAATVPAMAAQMPTQEQTTQTPPQGEVRPDLPRPYKCPLCDKAFHRLEHQTRHIRTHTGEKPHACQFPGCTKRFSSCCRRSGRNHGPGTAPGHAANEPHDASSTQDEHLVPLGTQLSAFIAQRLSSSLLRQRLHK